MAILLLVPVSLPARTWVVQQDGSGDFTDIQSAVDAASVGDTVLVGPGRYDSFHAVPDAPESWRVVADVTTDSLTIRGIDRDLAIVGPTEPYPAPLEANKHSWRERISAARPQRSSREFGQRGVGVGKRIYSYGITSGLSVTWITVENLTFENMDNGVDVYPSGAVRDCVFRHMHDAGIVGDKAYTLLVEDCEIYGAGTGIGIQAYGGGQQWVRIRRCLGENVYEMIYCQQHPDVVVEDCSAYGGLVDVWGGHAVVRRCRSEGGVVGVSVGWNGSVGVYDCDLDINKDFGIAFVVENSTVIGSGNILHGGDNYPTIKAFLGTMDFHGNHILHGNYPYTVEIRTHEGPIDAIDLRNNYWGTTSADTLAAWIWDGHDDPSVQTYVQYEPFSSVPIPTRKKSWGGVKALFR